MSDHDRYLANYHCGVAQVWCENKACELHFDGIEVDSETEFGQTTVRPEECPVCHGSWLYDKPVEEDEEGEDDPA